jgi:hypothetical protein
VRDGRNWEELRIAPLLASPVPIWHCPRLIICPLWLNDGIRRLSKRTGYFWSSASVNENAVMETRPSCSGSSLREVALGAMTTLSGVFQSKVVVHHVAEFLLAAQITFSCLNRRVSKQKLNLLKFSARQMA